MFSVISVWNEEISPKPLGWSFGLLVHAPLS